MNSLQWCDNDHLFVFGSLMDEDVLALVTAMASSDLQTVAGTVNGYKQCEVEEESYPVLVPCEGAVTDGVLVSGLTVQAIERVLFFEGEEYRLQSVEVLAGEGQSVVPAYYFCDTGAYTVRPDAWDFAHWRDFHKPAFIESSRAYMSLFGTMTAAEADVHWSALTQCSDTGEGNLNPLSVSVAVHCDGVEQNCPGS
jgi:gamma-glutamylcyclotransferase (GGCT)/AIG2-like uncharacterized protein YtfP